MAKTRTELKRIVMSALLTIVVVMLLRIFLFASFSIPTLSMQPTLIPGDHVLVNKLVPGARIDWLFQNHKRLRGYRAIAHGDILVFNTPYFQSNKIEKNLNQHYIKRCIGVPGDTLQIQGDVFMVKSSLGRSDVSKYLGKMDKKSWLYNFTPQMFKPLGWTVTSFGPIYIPKKGDCIVLDKFNVSLYKPLIEYETQKEMVVSDNYTFTQNYYFVVGDNVMDSEDSRFWGLLPEDHIVGKAAYIWKSRDPINGEYRFNRFFKSLNYDALSE